MTHRFHSRAPGRAPVASRAGPLTDPGGSALTFSSRPVYGATHALHPYPMRYLHERHRTN
jgi:hypothetical protein